MASLAFFTAERALWVKRRSFCKEITTNIDEAKSEAGLSKESFDKKKVHFEQHWDEIVTTTEGCIGLLDDGEEDKEEQITDLKYHVELLRGIKEQFLSFEVEIEKRLHMIDIKNVEIADGDTSQDGRKLAVDEFLSGEPTPSFIKKVEAAHDNGVVDPL